MATNRKLPAGVTIKFGRYYRVQSLGTQDGKRKQKWHPLSRVEDGLAALYMALANLEAAPSHDRMPEKLNAWMKDALPGLSAPEQIDTARMVEVVSKTFADFRAEQVQARHIHEFLTTNFVIPGKLRTAQRYRNVLNRFFRWSIVLGIRSDNPVEPINLKPPQKRDRYIADDEFHAVREALLVGDDGRKTASGPMMQVFVDLCYLTGQRSTDIRLLRWQQIDEEAIHFKPTKTAKSSGAKVRVPITTDVADVLARAKDLMRTKARLSPYVVHNLQGDAYMAHGVGAAWERACKRAGIENATVKDLRAKHATDAERLGYSVEDIRKNLAHEDSSTTRVYLKQRSENVSIVELNLPKRKRSTS